MRDNKPEPINFEAVREVEAKIEGFQDRLTPTGDKMKAAVLDKVPAQGLVQFGEA